MQHACRRPAGIIRWDTQAAAAVLAQPYWTRGGPGGRLHGAAPHAPAAVMRWNVRYSLPALKGGRPSSIWYSTQPSAHRSAAQERRRLRSTCVARAGRGGSGAGAGGVGRVRRQGQPPGGREAGRGSRLGTRLWGDVVGRAYQRHGTPLALAKAAHPLCNVAAVTFVVAALPLGAAAAALLAALALRALLAVACCALLLLRLLLAGAGHVAACAVDACFRFCFPCFHCLRFMRVLSTQRFRQLLPWRQLRGGDRAGRKASMTAVA